MLSMQSLDSFKCRRTVQVGTQAYEYYSLKAAEENGLDGISTLPVSLKVLLENLLRYEDDRTVTRDDILAMAEWLAAHGAGHAAPCCGSPTMSCQGASGGTLRVRILDCVS